MRRVLDIKLIREKPDFVRQRLATRGAGDEALIDDILQADEQRRKLLAEVEALKAQRNRVSKEIGALMGQKKVAEAEAKKKETRDLGDRIATLDKAGSGGRSGARCVDAAPAESAARIGAGRQERGGQSGHPGSRRETDLRLQTQNRTSSFARV